ncbi:cadherin domain-containing protein [Microvirga sp. RSM25]|uniref:cadherin domain-containing protein n=1 Tax=Microvirga sp. RSM25 TaxID=3273802 RepID=UPI003850D681
MQDIEPEGPPADTPPANIRLTTGGTTAALAENSGTNTVVGTVTADDNGGTAALRYAMAANGNFDINATTGQILVKNGAVLNFEGTNSFVVAVTATDLNGTGQSTTQNFTINLTNVNEAPNAPQYTSLGAIAETAGNGTQVGTITATDPDGTAPSLVFADTNTTTSLDGAFEIVGGVVRVKDATKIQVVNEASHTFTYNVKATDGSLPSGTTPISITVNDVTPPQNQKPTIDVNGGIQIIGATANGPAVKAFYDIQVGDLEDDPLTMSISFASNDGELRDQNNQVIAVKSDDGITKVYEFTGRKNVLNAILDELKFDAKNRSDGGIVDTNFTVKVWDIDHQGSPAQNNQITVSTALMNRAPTINLSDPKTFHVNDINDAVYAFGGFDLDDIERDQLTVTIKFDEDDGDLVGVNLPNPERIAGQKVYKFVNRTAGELELILDNLRFNATDRPNQNSGTVETTFTVEVSDGDKTATNGQLKVITDVVNKQPPTQNQAPTGLSLSLNAPLLSEYAVPGKDVVGTLSATDANGDALTYKLLDNAGGRFAIDGNKLVLAGLGVNFEDVPSHQIKVEASDGKATTEQVFTIGIKDETTLNIKGTKKNDKLNGGLLDDILKGGSGTGNDTIKGSTGDDKLYGENGNDSLQGGDGIDSLFGGAGNDTLKGEAGRDLVKGDAGNDKAYGGSGNDKLYGGKGNDLLKGDADDDILYGEAGNDQLYSGKGKDVFVFNQKPSKTANLDKIMDFNVADDTIWLENKIFTKLGKAGSEALPAALNAVSFVTGSKAKDSKDYTIYDKKKGILYYDADGTGKSAAVEIATIKKGLKLTFDDFKII